MQLMGEESVEHKIRDIIWDLIFCNVQQLLLKRSGAASRGIV
jgi:hypothetical protein